MLDTVQNLVDDYEIITKKESSGISQNGFRFTKLKTKSIRDYIKPNQKASHGHDASLQKIVTSAHEVRQFVESSLRTLGFTNLNSGEQFQNIAKMFMQRFSINRIKCRMDLVYSDKCRRFHVDNVCLRSITTLIGPGTELQMLDKPDEIFRVKTGDTVLVKGKQFPGEPTKVLHRSPRISHLGIPRLVFVMDYQN